MYRIIIVIGATVLASCAGQHQDAAVRFGNAASPQAAIELLSADKVTILDESDQPIPQASILIGNQPGDPFPGNVVSTNESGQATVPLSWHSELPLTVQKEGFVTLTIPSSTPGERTFHLSKTEGSKELEVSGITTNWPRIINNDGKVDFAIVIPSFKRSQIPSFDLSNVISPEIDRITVGTKEIGIPSNISLPKQSETYIIVPVTLDKLPYRNYARESGDYNYVAARGWFPLQRVVDDIRGGKSFYEVINYFQFESFGNITSHVIDNTGNQDVPVSTTALNKVFSVRAPNVGSSQTMLSFSLEERGGEFFTLDFKRANSGETINLKTSTTLGATSVLSAITNSASTSGAIQNIGPNDLFNLIREDGKMFDIATQILKNDFSQMSLSLHNPTQSDPMFLPLVAAPSVSPTGLTTKPPALPAGMEKRGMYAIYSEIKENNSDSKIKSETRTRLWEMHSTNWLSNIALPSVSFEKRPGFKYRWDVYFFASDISKATETAGDVDLNSVTHITRSATDVQ